MFRFLQILLCVVFDKGAYDRVTPLSQSQRVRSQLQQMQQPLLL
jgi:hypothetical protein